MDKKKTFSIIGTGVIGTTLAVLLTRSGYTCVAAQSRSRSSLERFRGYCPVGQATADMLRAGTIFVTTQDEYIEEVAAELSQLPLDPGTFLAHCSGSLPSSVMAMADVRVLSLHPLQAAADVETALELIPGAHFCLEGSDEVAEARGLELIQALGGIPHRIAPTQKAAYHAGAVVASNYLVALAGMASRLFAQAGIPAEEAMTSLLPLMLGTCRNLEQAGLPLALTGPIQRGDVSVLEKHLQVIPSDLQGAYKELGRLTLALALDKKTLLGTSFAEGIPEQMRTLLAASTEGVAPRLL
jgi:predicted short-subunit dehydrogenase-like oxidoreductase (DUF2520 family)